MRCSGTGPAPARHMFDPTGSRLYCYRCRYYCKTMQKVSGCFRSVNGARGHLIIASYLGTRRK